MHVTLAGRTFYLTPVDVEQALGGVEPEEISGMSVTIGGTTYPLMQVGALISHQDRRDFSAAEVLRALRKLGFTCHPATPASLL